VPKNCNKHDTELYLTGRPVWGQKYPTTFQTYFSDILLCHGIRWFWHPIRIIFAQW